MNQEQEIVIEIRGSVGVITLNRPQALNALSFNMIGLLSAQLERWREDAAIMAVFFQGAGDRAFCAGGDIKMAYHAGLAFKKDPAAPSPTDFFRDEYRLNRMLFHYPKPLIAYMDGITMGGGYGIAGNCRYRIVSDKTVFAMPEVGIGFFPDVGAAYHLSRAKGRSGFYLGLTGNSVSGADMVYAGLAEYYIPHADKGKLMAALGQEDIKAALGALHVTPQKGVLEVHASDIDAVFATDDPQVILAEWGGSDLCKIMTTRSPTSLKISARHLTHAADRSFDESIEEDFTLARHCMAGHDIYEGIRAQLIDKDKSPRWNPATLDAVSPALVAAHFYSDGKSLG